MSRGFVTSIWEVDPVGGSFVDWPEDLECSDAGLPGDWSRAWLLRFGSRYLLMMSTLDQNTAAIWIPHDELAAFEAECQTVLAAAPPNSRVSPLLKNLIGAAQFAKAHADAGVCIT